MSEQPETPASNAPMTVTDALDHAKRAFALRKYEQAVEHYATALELLSETHAEDAPEMADMYLAYGKALLENAISQSSVLGKEQPQEGGPVEEPAPGGKILSFSGDVEDEEDPAVDLFAEAAKAEGEGEAEAEGEGEEEEDAEGEPEDDFNAAWEVLDLARAIYERQMEGDDAVRLKAADTFILLGDVSLETEKFDQAITDYSAGLALKSALLPLSSRQLAEVHYKLSIALDLTAGRLAEAIHHAQRALESIEARLVELQAGLAGTLPPIPDADAADAKGKGKGKAAGGAPAPDELVQNWSKAQIEAEIKELGELKQDLALKVEELKSAPNDVRDGEISAPELAQRALDRELNGAPATRSDQPVNDLTAMVVKKKKKAPEAAPASEPAPASSAAEKRKADDDGAQTPPDKKARLEESAATS
ncbi:hypothetical protein BC834DRAFT_342680 [Gloeopeniophorella convolvens]|nr:hypothetical protein BC834DRAFT_342680 [Gloeopeniophorella convolvens]